MVRGNGIIWRVGGVGSARNITACQHFVVSLSPQAIAIRPREICRGFHVGTISVILIMISPRNLVSTCVRVYPIFLTEVVSQPVPGWRASLRDLQLVSTLTSSPRGFLTTSALILIVILGSGLPGQKVTLQSWLDERSLIRSFGLCSLNYKNNWQKVDENKPNKMAGYQKRPKKV